MLGHSKVDRDGTPIPVPTPVRVRRSARRPAPESVELAGATWRQVEATGARTVLAVPLGSLEQHGPHLPLDTDTRIAVAVAAGLAGALRAAWPWRPPSPTGPAASTPGSPARSSSGTTVLAELLVELVRSARSSFAGVVLVNAHGGNEEALAAGAAALRGRGRRRAGVARRVRRAATRTPAGPRRR